MVEWNLVFFFVPVHRIHAYELQVIVGKQPRLGGVQALSRAGTPLANGTTTVSKSVVVAIEISCVFVRDATLCREDSVQSRAGSLVRDMARAAQRSRILYGCLTGANRPVSIPYTLSKYADSAGRVKNGLWRNLK